MYLRRLPEVELPDLSPEQLLAEICDLLEFVSDRPSGDSKIRVFKPQGGECGYTTPGSVVQVVSDDRTFLVDSVSAAVATADATVVRHLHPLIGTVRDDEGSLTGIIKARGASRRESVQHFELDRELSEEESEALEAAIHRTLIDISKVVSDFEPMRAIVGTMIRTAATHSRRSLKRSRSSSGSLRTISYSSGIAGTTSKNGMKVHASWQTFQRDSGYCETPNPSPLRSLWLTFRLIFRSGTSAVICWSYRRRTGTRRFIVMLVWTTSGFDTSVRMTR